MAFYAGLYYFLRFEIQARNDKQYSTNDKDHNKVSRKKKGKCSLSFLAEKVLVMYQHSLMGLAMKVNNKYCMREGTLIILSILVVLCL